MKRINRRVAACCSVGACLALLLSLTVASCNTKSENIKPILHSQSDSPETFADDSPPIKPTGPGGG